MIIRVIYWRSFTLIELIIAITIIVFLVTVLLTTIKPPTIFENLRDTTRVVDLNNIDKAIYLLTISDSQFNLLNYASSNVIYLSLPDTFSTCETWLTQLPSLPSGWRYHCVATPTNIDGTGWIPIPFNQFPVIENFSLPIDPINKPPHYYGFIAGEGYVLYNQLENFNSQISKEDNDNHPHLYSVGRNKSLLDEAQGLVGYWPLNEGVGSTTKDYSGNENHGIFSTPEPQWVEGKIGKALSFNQNYVNIGTTSSSCILNFATSNFSVIFFAQVSEANYFGRAVSKMGHTGTGSPDIAAGWYVTLVGGDNNQGAIAWGIGDGTNLWTKEYHKTTVIPNTWYMVAGVFDREKGLFKSYLNGKNIGQTDISQYGSVSNRRMFRIGARDYHYLPSSPSYFHGIIDEVRVYNRVLNDFEISSIYKSLSE